MTDLTAEDAEIAEGIFLSSAVSACSAVTASLHPKPINKLQDGGTGLGSTGFLKSALKPIPGSD
jgi:hypothetical protein